MPAIADQVATMEHDHAAALAQIDELTSSLAAVKAALSSAVNENLTLRDQNQDLTAFANETRATVETLALGTMELLRASRRPVGGVAAATVLPFAAKPKLDRVFSDELLAKASTLLAKASTLPETWPGGVQTATEAAVAARVPVSVEQKQAIINAAHDNLQAAELLPLQGDSGDETDQDRHMTAAEIATLEEQDAGNANAISSDTTEAVDSVNTLSSQPGLGVWPNGRPVVGLSGPTLTPMPVNEFVPPSLAPTLVVHDDHDLPIFLTRDRPFINAADRAIFG